MNLPTHEMEDMRDSTVGLAEQIDQNCMTFRTSNDLGEKKENKYEMQNKLQSIQSGKAYLEKKIQEYEARLNQMKQKKEKTYKGHSALSGQMLTSRGDRTQRY